MSEAVKASSGRAAGGARPDLRRRRTVDTERRILEAATRLFVSAGYDATTVAAVAAEAGVADRTVYVRFGRKAVLFQRVIDLAIVGDLEDVDLRGREWFTRAMSAPSLAERVEAMASMSADLMSRFGPLLEAIRVAEAMEPELAPAAQAGRDYTLATVRTVWERLVADGLVDDSVDVEWTIATTGLLVAPDTYYSVMRMLGWDNPAYGRWLARALWHLMTNPSPADPPF